MPDLEINGIHMPIRPEIYNWEQLLNELETKHLSTGQVISSVSFDVGFRSSLLNPFPSKKSTRVSLPMLNSLAAAIKRGVVVSAINKF